MYRNGYSGTKFGGWLGRRGRGRMYLGSWKREATVSMSPNQTAETKSGS